MPSLLVIALVIPLITIVQIHPDGIELQLNYLYTHSTLHGSWDSETSNYATYEISTAVNLDNLSLVLSDEEVREYPVWVNVSSWGIGDTVLICGQVVTIMGESDRGGLQCWIGELLNGTDVYYSKEFGVFLGTYYYEWDWSGGTYSNSERRQIELTYQNLEDLYRVEYVLSFDAILLSFIILESAAISWLIEKGRRGVLLRKS